MQIFTHAIGDRAIRQALDAYENAQETNHTQDARHRIEHIEMRFRSGYSPVRQAGRDRQFSAACMPIRMTTSLKVWPRTSGRSARNAHGLAQHESRGGVLAFGSDWPIVTMSPWPGVQNALTAANRRKAILPAALFHRSASAWKTPSRPILWARLLPDIAKRQKARSSPENWPT